MHEGPNGHHQCLVFELLGPTIDVIMNDCGEESQEEDHVEDDVEDYEEAEDILRMSTQLLRAIAFIHRAGYAHGGMVECHPS